MKPTNRRRTLTNAIPLLRGVVPGLPLLLVLGGEEFFTGRVALGVHGLFVVDSEFEIC